MTDIDRDITLSGALVRLEPLSHDHHDGLVEATNDDYAPIEETARAIDILD